MRIIYFKLVPAFWNSHLYTFKKKISRCSGFGLTCWYSMLQGKITYVVRPLLPSSCVSKSGLCGNIGTKDPLNLGGYGVELALKNMEYKAMDDSAVKKGQFFF